MLPAAEPLRVAVVGCGYVAEFYGATLRHHPELALQGAFDRDAANLQTFCRRQSARAYASLDAVLADPLVEAVLVLTDPRSHYAITRRCLEAGKHVYSEKPLAMELEEARQLAALATSQGLYLSTAPSSVLSDTAQTLWKGLKDGAIGRPCLVYANFDDGMLSPARQQPWLWRNAAGTPWPAKDEFEVGCTYEHAGYLLTWLAAFFGPVRAVTAFASCLLPDKGIPVDAMAPDFTVGCLEYDDGIVARLTCGLAAPEDKSLTLIGDEGVLSVSSVRDESAPVYLRRVPQHGRMASVDRRLDPVRRWMESALSIVPWSGRPWHLQQRYPPARRSRSRLADVSKRVDFCRGPAELATAIRERRPCRLSAALGVHVVDVTHALQHPAGRQPMLSTFDRIEPLEWR